MEFNDEEWAEVLKAAGSRADAVLAVVRAMGKAPDPEPYVPPEPAEPAPAGVEGADAATEETEEADEEG